jgi:hypothetical protein
LRIILFITRGRAMIKELKIITEEGLLQIMTDPEALITLMKYPYGVMYDVIQYGGKDGIIKTFESCTKLSKRQLFSEGLMLLGRLPTEERIKVLKGLQKLNIPCSIWYKTFEENVVFSQEILTTLKEPHMTTEKKTSHEPTSEPSYTEKMKNAGETFWGIHGSKIKNISLLFLGAAVGVLGKTYADTHRVIKVSADT